MAVRSEIEIVAINTGLSLLGEFYQQLSLIKTICTPLATTHNNTRECRAVVCYTIHTRNVSSLNSQPTLFCHFFVEENLVLLPQLYHYKRFICINGKPLYTFHPGFPGLGWDISSLVKTRCIISCRIYIPQ